MEFNAKLSESELLDMLGREIKLTTIKRVLDSDSSDEIKVKLIRALVED